MTKEEALGLKPGTNLYWTKAGNIYKKTSGETVKFDCFLKTDDNQIELDMFDMPIIKTTDGERFSSGWLELEESN